ncbi:hypothetical protein LRP31_25460 [Mesorhizobium mediterraneum]|nr:hypothetical protein [Mesorhizobium mediterraneum]WIW52370.1 hypothetical protein LRP31_25460 [Mesorhizobium mediterraneum]
MSALLDLTGRRFGRLAVIRRAENIRGRPAWECVCECGDARAVSSSSLLHAGTQSCGCLCRERLSASAKVSSKTHGRASTSEYRSWCAMKSRCLNSNATGFDRYGGVGVTVCAQWLGSFEAFIADMGEKPTPEHSLDRWPDKSGNYEPGNCRWATKREQANNRKDNNVVVYRGRSVTVREIAAAAAVSRTAIVRRVGRGWDAAKAIETPAMRACR